jgi:DNA repair exonuclease SbcCD ATPase subunit
MVKVIHGSTETHGRLVGEDDDAVRVQTYAGGTIRYEKSAVRLERYELPEADYYLNMGQALQADAWDTPDPAARFRKAQGAYRRALTAAPATATEQRARQALEALEDARDAWHREVIRQEELNKARAETRKAQLEQEVLSRKIATLQQHAKAINELATDMDELTDAVDDLAALLRHTVADLERVEEDVDDIEDDRARFVIVRDFHRYDRRVRDQIKNLDERLKRLEDPGP